MAESWEEGYIPTRTNGETYCIDAQRHPVTPYTSASAELSDDDVGDSIHFYDWTHGLCMELLIIP